MGLLKSKKIAFSSNTSFSLYNFRYGLMKHFKDLGFEVYAIAPKDEYAQDLEKEFKFIEIKHLNRKGTNPFKDLRLFLEYARIFHSIKPDLVLSYTIKPNIYGSFACGIMGIKCISNVTGLGYVFMKENWLSKVVKQLYKSAFSFNKKIVFLNNSDLEIFLKYNIVSSKQIFMINGEGINTDYFSRSACKEYINDRLTFLLIARMLWDKGVGEFVKASEIVKRNHSNAEFWLLGPIDNDNPSAVSKSVIEDWESKGLVKYLGSTKDVRPFICKADVVVLPSYYREGIPRSLLEAMSMEKPIITTNEPGCRDVCSSDINGLLVPAKDANALAQAMIKLIEMPKEQRVKMGCSSRQMILEKFDEKIIISKYYSLVREILNV
ncbi:MAG: glycosyltransferase family 4 protein [Thermoplasmata archaeon]